MQSRDDPLFHAIVDLATQQPIGVASYLRIDPAMGAIEVGHLSYAPALQRTRASTEAMYLMMRCAFEGIFRQAAVMKGRDRDTAWFSIVDGEWPALHFAFEQWLDPSNFDATGAQRRRLEAFR